MISTTHRSKEVEIMDDFQMEGALLRSTLDQIATINRRLGGNKVTMDGLQKILKGKEKTKTVTIVDIGCGGGDLLREIAEFGKKEGWKFNLIGVDANVDTIRYASSLSQRYDNITYSVEDVMREQPNEPSYDIVLCTLFLHHFDDIQCKEILARWFAKSKWGFVVNDLQRSFISYYLFKGLCLFISNPMVKNDGLISILRSFKKKELEALTDGLTYKRTIKWMWAFRYQMILEK